PTGSKLLSGELVKEADVKAWAGDYDLIHLSVHGVFVAQEPLLSHLRLGPGGAEDGKLTAAEMFGLPLAGARLIVLSACDTGQARATRANEVSGMVRSLLYAGANTLVLSSWAIDADSTALWMETFYREAQSRPPAGAARLAIAAVRRDPRYSHPYYWAPFLLTGR
ncbi:MAG TPA: CHAT domain-containing protein, partial [Blastocatellia bacterium]|nr:CHAT domain-containing protein [Blastocatellia bacterium]